MAEAYDLDLLHVHYAIPHSISAMLAQQMLAPKRRLPFITTLHGTDITLVGADPSYFPITKFSIEQSDGITSISEDLRATDGRGLRRVERNPRHSRTSSTATSTIPTRESRRVRLRAGGREAADPPFQLPPGEARAGLHSDSGRSAQAYAGAPADGGRRPGPRPRPSTWSRQLKLTPHVSFLGKQNHVERLIPLAHVLLMPSEMESFGLVALEAMACGVAPVATHVGGVPELITDGENGFMEPVGDIAAQSARTVELLTDDALHQRITAAGRQRALDVFCSERIIPQYEQYYRDVMARQV